MKDYETDPSSIWKSEIFGRSLDVIVKEGIQGKLSLMPETTRFKLGSTITKIVNKGKDSFRTSLREEHHKILLFHHSRHRYN